MPPPFRIITAAATDVGRAREVNEDAYSVHPEHNTWVLADGMGGHVGGRIASRIAADAVADFMVRWRKEPDFVWPFEIMESRSHDENAIANAIRVANVRVYNRSQVDESCAGMGTTLVAMTYSPEAGFVIGHVGDSRCYRLRKDELTLLTEDHSLVNHLKKFYHLTEQQARAKAGKNVIIRAVGLEDDVDPELTLDVPEAGDVYLACSDGLSEMVDDWIMTNILIGHQEHLDDAANALIRAANQNGGNDNITVVLVRFLKG